MGARKTKSLPRNKVLPGGISRYSRTQIYAKKASYKVAKAVTPKPKVAAASTKTVKMANASTKNGSTRTVAISKGSKFYPTVDVPKKLANNKHNSKTKLRSSISAGSIVVLLSGPHRGKVCYFYPHTYSCFLNELPFKRC